MNHHMAYNGNLPHGVSQGDIDAVFGPSLSGDGEDALTAHDRIQTLRMQLLEAIRANSDVLAFDIYEDLEAALRDAEYTPAQIQDRVFEEDAERAEDERLEAIERRAESRRDWYYAS